MCILSILREYQSILAIVAINIDQCDSILSVDFALTYGLSYNLAMIAFMAVYIASCK